MSITTAIKSKTAKKIASNTIYQIIGKAFTMTVTVIITILVTRNYGRIGYGEFNIMQTFPALFFIVVDFGINAIATRELSSDWQKAEEYFSNILGIRIVLSLALILFAAFALMFFPYSSGLKFGAQIGLLLILTQALFTTTNIIFQVKLRYDYSTIGLIVGYFIIAGFSYLATELSWNVMWVNFSYVIGGLVTFLVNLYFVQKLGVRIGLNFDSKLWKFLFLQSWPLGLMFVFSQINFKSDVLLLSILNLPDNLGLNNTESVALYGLPYKIFEVSLVVPTFFMNSVYPVFVRHMHEGEARLKESFMNSMKVLFAGGILVGLGGYIFAPWIIDVLGGSQFTQSVDVLRILLAGMFIFYLTQPISWLIVTLSKQKYLPIIYFASAAFNLFLNFILIPRYSFYASAYLTWMSEILIFVLLVFAAHKAWRLYYAENS